MLIIVVFSVGASNEQPISYEKKTPLPFMIPKGWPSLPKNIFSKNKLTEEGFQLGKKLFYDVRLSKDNTISCGSCHQQFASFANYDHDVSHGIHNSFTNRNAPALINVAWMPLLHWDGAINHIEMQPLAPITSPNEMGEQLDEILTKLKNDSTYKRMFASAFGDNVISTPKILKALAQFVGNLVSADSKYDKVKRGEQQFTAFEERGYVIFKTYCNGCHTEPLFTNHSLRNNGQVLNKYNDIGYQKITNLRKDSLKFKVPTLRNVQLTLPYMHDGHINSLSQVIEYYSNGIDTSSLNLDPLLKKKILLTPKQKMELQYFLYTLTDSSFVKNPRFSFLPAVVK